MSGRPKRPRKGELQPPKAKSSRPKNAVSIAKLDVTSVKRTTSPAEPRQAKRGRRSTRAPVTSKERTVEPDTEAPVVVVVVEPEPAVASQDNGLEYVMRFWTHQVEAPSAIFQGALWDAQPYIVVVANGLYDEFLKFMQDHAVQRVELGQDHPVIPDWISAEPASDDAPVPTKTTTVKRADFFTFSSVLVPGVKHAKLGTTVPNRHTVRQALRRLATKVYNATRPLVLAPASVKKAFGDPANHSLVLVVTPFMKRADTKDDSWISYYNATATERLDATCRLQSTRMADMGTVHPMFLDPAWSSLLHSAAGLASVHDLFIYFRFELSSHYQYVFLHDQVFELLDVVANAECADTLMDRYAIGVREDLSEQETRGCRSFFWLCDLGAPDTAHIRLQVPSYRGLRLRFLFRQDYSKWFF